MAAVSDRPAPQNRNRGLDLLEMSFLGEASHDTNPGPSNGETVPHQSPPGFEDGLCAIRVPDGVVQYVSGYDRYQGARTKEHVHDQMQRAIMRFSWQVLMSLEQTAEKVSSQTSEYRQVYVVVSKMGVPWDVYYFIQAQARDDLVPFMLTQDGKALQPWLTEEEEASGVSAPLKVPGWEDGRYLEFHNVQWEQLALKFKLGESYELYANSVVPLIEEVPERRLNGCRSAVLRPGNYDFWGVNDVPRPKQVLT